MKGPAALRKAKQAGRRKKFYITSPSGWKLSDLLPWVDKLSRLSTDLFVQERIDLAEYKARKSVLYACIEAMDDWYNEQSETVCQLQGPKLAKLKDRAQGIKTVYCNTQTGVDAYHCFVRCDLMHCVLVNCLKHEAVSAKALERSTHTLLSIMDNFESELRELEEDLCTCRASTGRKPSSENQSPIRDF